MKKLLATALLLLAASGVVVLLHSDDDAQRSADARATSTLAARPVIRPLAQPVVPTRSRPLRVPGIPIAAIRIADQYAIAAFTTHAGTAANSWIAALAPLCTAGWHDALLVGQHTTTTSSTTSYPTVVRNYPSHAPARSVAVTVQLSGTGERSGPTLYVVLVERDGQFLVDDSQ